MSMFRRKPLWRFLKSTISGWLMARDDYNWIDDPFDEKKNREIEQKAMGGSSRAFLGIGCVVAITLVIAAGFVFFGLIDAISAA